MSTPNMPALVLPRDCYTSYQVRSLFGRRNDAGKLVPISRVTLKRWRQKGRLQYITVNCRVFLYPKTSVQALIQESNGSLWA